IGSAEVEGNGVLIDHYHPIVLRPRPADRCARARRVDVALDVVSQRLCVERGAVRKAEAFPESDNECSAAVGYFVSGREDAHDAWVRAVLVCGQLEETTEDGVHQAQIEPTAGIRCRIEA